MEDHSNPAPRPQNSTTIAFAKPGTAPPVFVATSFTSPPWAPLEMSAKVKPSADDKAPKEYQFSRDFDDVPDGVHHYKFRLGPGDWWSVAEDQKTDTDEHGNRNNVLHVGPNKTPAAIDTKPSPAATETKPSGATPETKPPTIEAVKDAVKDAGAAVVNKVNPAAAPAVVSAAATSGSLPAQESSDKKSSLTDAVKTVAANAAASVSNTVAAADSLPRPAVISSPRPEQIPLPSTPVPEPPAKRQRLSFSAAARAPDSTPDAAGKSTARARSSSPSPAKTPTAPQGKSFIEHEARSLVATLAFLKLRIDAVLENARRRGLDNREVDAITEHEPGRFPQDTDDAKPVLATAGKAQAPGVSRDKWMYPMLGSFVGCTLSWVVMCWLFGMPRGRA